MEKKALFGAIGIALIIVIALIVLLAIYIIGAYNNFITLDQGIQGKWSEVQSQYERQAELIPNLVSAVSSSVRIETNFVKDITDARTKYESSKLISEKDQAGVELTNSVTTFVNAVAENYPQLQANKQYIALTDELSGTQNRITTARGRYIEAIQAFNTATKTFPNVFIARMFGFSEKQYYQADINAMKTPSLGNGTLP